MPAAALAVTLAAPPRAPAALREAVGSDPPAALAAALVAPGAHWSVESEWPEAMPPPRALGPRDPLRVARRLDVLDADGVGLWILEPDGGDVRLEPSGTSEAWRRLAALLPRA